MVGWLSAGAARASARKRAMRPVSRTISSGRTLRATSRPSRGSRARQTSPIPPAPSGATTSYGPIFEPSLRGMSSSADYDEIPAFRYGRRHDPSWNPNPLDQSREPGVVADPVPCRIHFEKDHPGRALHERRLEVLERLLPFSYLRLQPRQFERRDVPFLREGPQITEPDPRHRDLRALVVLHGVRRRERLHAVVLTGELVRLAQSVDRARHVALAPEDIGTAELSARVRGLGFHGRSIERGRLLEVAGLFEVVSGRHGERQISRVDAPSRFHQCKRLLGLAPRPEEEGKGTCVERSRINRVGE